MTRRLPMLVTDLDRTFSDTRLRLVPSALRAMQQARDLGHPTILATGRTLAELRRKPHALDVFDYVIVEGGGLLGTPRRVQPLGADRRTIHELHLWLNEAGVLHYPGIASLSISRADLPILQGFPGLRRLQVIPNRNRADITLRGVDKGTALRRLRTRPPLRGRTAIGFGDGENDVGLFRAIERRVAVRNAVPALKRMAHEVTRYPGGRGVADFLQRNILLRQPVLKSRPHIGRAWTQSSNSRRSPRSSTHATAKPSPPSTRSR